MFQSLLNPNLIFTIIAVPISVMIHELSHAAVANALGDKTASRAGRLSLNPMVHFEPLGLLMMFFGPIGWAKPVPINPNNFKNPRFGFFLSVLAGPVSNFVLAIVCFLTVRVMNPDTNSSFLFRLIAQGAIVNVCLTVFNLLPLFPLDGARIVQSLLPNRWSNSFGKFAVYSPFVLLLIVVIPPLNQAIFSPLLNGSLRIVAQWFGLVVS